MAYFGNASRQLLESLQGVGGPTQISEKLELVTKIMFGYHGYHGYQLQLQHLLDGRVFVQSYYLSLWA